MDILAKRRWRRISEVGDIDRVGDRQPDADNQQQQNAERGNGPIDDERNTSKACVAAPGNPASRRRLSSYSLSVANGPIRAKLVAKG